MRLVRERAGDGNALLLAAGEPARHMVGAAREADGVEEPDRRVAAVGDAARRESNLDVLRSGESRDEVELLEHEPEGLKA